MVWLGFSGLVIALLVLDLGVLNRHSHAMNAKAALTWSGGLVAMALGFGVFLLYREGHHQALEFYTGYLIELSLSVDNLFVFLLIFQYFAVPADLQPRVLKWGILGAIVMRAIMIGAGTVLLHRFEWIIYLFGGVLAITGLRMLRSEAIEVEPDRNPLVRLVRRLLPVTQGYRQDHFWIHEGGKLVLTPLLLVVLVVEWSDVVFAIDSIPAIFSVTRDPFIVYSSNVFAILGLRALFFVLATMMTKFRFLKVGVAVILIFVGAKMVAEYWIQVPVLVSLGVIVGTLTAAIAASVLLRPRAAG